MFIYNGYKFRVKAIMLCMS